MFSAQAAVRLRGFVFATLAIGALSFGVWAHHMFTTGAVAAVLHGLSFLIAVPTGVKFFNWIATMWGGRSTFPTPMLFSDRLPRSCS